MLVSGLDARAARGASEFGVVRCPAPQSFDNRSTGPGGRGNLLTSLFAAVFVLVSLTLLKVPGGFIYNWFGFPHRTRP